MIIKDIHTHDPSRAGAVINWRPGMDIIPGNYYSAGVHPWYAGDMAVDEAVLDAPGMVAVGEVGLDKLRGPSLQVQSDELRRWLDLAQRKGLPVILHVVKAYQEIMALKKEIAPSVPWIIHGFRGKPELARELVRHGFYISLGRRYNGGVPAVVPRDRLLVESDEDVSVPVIPCVDSELADRLFLKK